MGDTPLKARSPLKRPWISTLDKISQTGLTLLYPPSTTVNPRYNANENRRSPEEVGLNTAIQRIVRNHYEQLHAKKLDNFGEMEISRNLQSSKTESRRGRNPD